MDKRKVILAYRRGFITLHECAQILGIDSLQILGMLEDAKASESSAVLRKQPAHG